MTGPIERNDRRPNSAQLERIAHAHKRLLEIADKKDKGIMRADTARKKATEAIDQLAPHHDATTTNGIIAHLHRICLNGWVREAADKMLECWPEINRLDTIAIKRKATK